MIKRGKVLDRVDVCRLQKETGPFLRCVPNGRLAHASESQVDPLEVYVQLFALNVFQIDILEKGR